jgi:hypothetical protein
MQEPINTGISEPGGSPTFFLEMLAVMGSGFRFAAPE